MLGAVPTPPTAPVESESDSEMEDAPGPSGQSSQTTVVGRPILESGSRSQHFRTPRIDYNNPTVAAQYVQVQERCKTKDRVGGLPRYLYIYSAGAQKSTGNPTIEYN